MLGQMRIAVMGPQGAAEIIYKHEIKQADDPEAMLEEKVAAYREGMNPYKAAVEDSSTPLSCPKKVVKRLHEGWICFPKRLIIYPVKNMATFPCNLTFTWGYHNYSSA